MRTSQSGNQRIPGRARRSLRMLTRPWKDPRNWSTDYE
jgi:hypothetical protein